jgi:hypothetical protein
VLSLNLALIFQALKGSNGYHIEEYMAKTAHEEPFVAGRIDPRHRAADLVAATVLHLTVISRGVGGAGGSGQAGYVGGKL